MTDLALPPNVLVIPFGIDPKAFERARKAEENFRRELWEHQAFLRALTRNPEMILKIGSPRTDGKTVWVKPPIAFGDDVRHERSLCAKRDGKGQQRCPACLAYEDVMVQLCHEIAHITEESFAIVEDDDKVRLIDEAVRLEAARDSKRAAKIRQRLADVKTPSYIAAANSISPFLGVVVNAIEDARVNQGMWEVRPGLMTMFDAQTVRIFERGIERADGTLSLWRDQPVNPQAVIAVYCKASGLNYNEWLSPEVVAALDDPELDALCQQAAKARSARATYRLAFPILERLRTLGFCRTPDDPEEEDDSGEGESGEGQQSQQQQQSQGQGEKSEPKGGGSDASSMPSEGSTASSNDESESDEDEESGAGGDDADDADEEGDDGASDGTEEPATDDDAGSNPDGGTQDTSDPENGAENAGKDADDSTDSDTESEDEGESGDTYEPGDAFDGANPEKVDLGDVDSEPAPAPTTGNPAIDGTPELTEELLKVFGRHDGPTGGVIATGTEQEDAELDRAIVQAEFFDAPSRNVYTVHVHEHKKHVFDSYGTDLTERLGWRRYGNKGGDIDVPENILAPALLKARIAFSNNRKARVERNLRSGRVDTRTLARRIPVRDDRVFGRKEEPDDRDYFVLIGLDISGSTNRGDILNIIKRAALAKAEMLHRLGVKFAMYAHTGSGADTGDYGRSAVVDVFVVKGPEEPWTDECRMRLRELTAGAYNLDGHTLEFYRKAIQRRRETDKIILYYTDGAMPMENFDEELDILQREIRLCKRTGIQLVGVGIRNNDPAKHGLDTVRLDRVEDVSKVVKELERRLTR